MTNVKNEENDWTDDEDIFVFVDYGQFLGASDVLDPELQFKVVGLETERVLTEINGKLFSGSYADSLGTDMFFAEDPTATKSDNVFDRVSDQTYILHSRTSKVVPMNRIFVEPKKSEEAPKPAETKARSYEIDVTYQEALDKLLKPGQLPPRTVTDTLDNKIRLQRDLRMELEMEEDED